MWITIWTVVGFIGMLVESRYHFIAPDMVGKPKSEIPNYGSVMHMEAVFPDSTFVAVYAGERAFYKNADKNQRLEAGKAYEVVDMKIQNGGHEKAIVMIRDGISNVAPRPSTTNLVRTR